MRVAVVGSWKPGMGEMSQFQNVWDHIRGSVLLHGASPGVGTEPTDDVASELKDFEKWAESFALERGIEVERFPPKQLAIGWPACGHTRWREMVAASEFLVAFPGPPSIIYCIMTAKRHGIPIFMVGEWERWEKAYYRLASDKKAGYVHLVRARRAS